MKNDVPVLIVGAGPTGLTAAMELSRLGIGVRIIDRAPERSLTSRALGVQARTIELLRGRGVGDEMLRLGNRASATTLYSGGKKLGAIELHRMPSEFNFVLLLAQSETERLLTQQLHRQGVEVERGIEIVSMSRRTDRVDVQLGSGAETTDAATASYLIAADGSHSAIRKQLGLPFKGRSLAQNYVLGDLRLDGDIPEDQLSVFLARNGFLAVFPMGNGRFRFMATDPEGVTGDAAEPSLEDIQCLYDRTVHLPARLCNLNWSSRFRINSRHMTTLRDGRVFFGGDAAHVHSPAGGQGMNAGIQDMINLSWKLAMVVKGQARPELLDTYESDRLPVIHDLVQMTERATGVFNSTNPLVHAALTRFAPVLLGLPAVQNKTAPKLGQLTAGYRGCPIAKGGGRIGQLQAGDRMPDLRVDGVRLVEMLDLSTLTLFVTPDAGRISDAYRPWRHILAVRPVSLPDEMTDGWLLVRPDGYLAAAGSSGDARRLAGWLDRWLIRTAR
ncbi:FAD-dependent monooxygenase [Nocardia sp. NPDC057663]|uniref:FAD-dependent monooxygenase n=1 Tax=Nocardia sp. NPDC057663 TaxID=3346201 RepID=UPI0036726CB2